MSTYATLDDVSFAGKQVLLRVDFNCPLNPSSEITDDTRIKAALPTIQFLLEAGASLVLMSHMGRPKGKRVAELSLAPCARRLSQLLGCPVKMAPDCVGSETEALAHELQEGEILVLENLRFHDAETKPEKDLQFAANLARLGDLFVNDAFGTAHRAHSSTVEITKHMPLSVAGRLLEREIEALSKLLREPKRPFWGLVGGSKVSTKLGVLESLSQKADGLLIGGAMSFTLLKAKGYKIGSSRCEEAEVENMKRFLNKAAESGAEVFLPTDVIIAQEISENTDIRTIQIEDGIPDAWMGLDIGPNTRATWTSILKKAGSVLWNGPVGVFECPPFSQGTLTIASLLAELDADTVIGGGDSVAAVQLAGTADQMTHISTGGGASLEFIEFGTLPAIEALSTKRTTSI